MSIDIDRLKVDAGYWKENGAPDDATHCAVHDPGKTWFKFGEDGSPMMWHMRFSEWREGLCKESRLVDLIPRLAKADELEWNGTGRPPVGSAVVFPTGRGVVRLEPDANNVLIVESDQGEYRRVSASVCEAVGTLEETSANLLARDLLDDLDAVGVNIGGGTAVAIAISLMNRGWVKGAG